MAQFEFPLQFKKQYAAPLDVDIVFDTTSNRLTFLTSPIRYAGQIVSDLETEKCYQLSTDTNSWIEIGGESLSLLNSLSTNWDSVYTSVLNTSANWDSVYSSVKDTSANWDSVYSSVKDTSANWDSVYSSVLNTSANWDSVYAFVSSNSATYATYNYVDTNFLNLTGGIIDGNLSVLSSFEVGFGSTVLFASGGKVGINTELPTVELTVNGSISASNKIYGTIIDWMTLTRGFKTEPTLNTTIAGGDVYNYVYESSPTDKTYYRYIATDGSEDAYYEDFSGGILSNLITKKKIIV